MRSKVICLNQRTYQLKHQNNALILILSSFYLLSGLFDVIKVALMEAVHYFENCIILLIAVDCFV